MPKHPGHTKYVGNAWTEEELSFLKKNYGTFKSNKPPKELQHRSSKSIRTKASQLGLKCSYMQKCDLRKTYKCNDDFFKTPGIINSYWAGFIAADGNVDKTRLRIKISNKDKNHLEKFKKSLDFTGYIKDYINKSGYKKSQMCSLEICCSSTIINDLKENFSIVPNKTLKLKRPKCVTMENKLSFCVGLIDGDGSIYKSRGSIHLDILGTEDVLNFVNETLKECLKLEKGKTILTRGNVSRLCLNGKELEDLILIVTNSGIPYLERKWNIDG